METWIIILGIIALMIIFTVIGYRTGSMVDEPHRQRFEPDPTTATNEDVMELLRRNRKVSAIKLYREINKVSLKEAKEVVELLETQL
ncbi:MAG: hypothetical protein AAF902_12405 [Chloroflexota bacterium]